ncbi:MAG: permease-like cell division protein FtsX, partial [Desulfocucumaceae bacterium]
IIGLTGALIAVAAINLFYGRLTENIALTISFLPVMKDKTIMYGIFRNLIIMGTALGALGSAISLRRFLRV